MPENEEREVMFLHAHLEVIGATITEFTKPIRFRKDTGEPFKDRGFDNLHQLVGWRVDDVQYRGIEFFIQFSQTIKDPKSQKSQKVTSLLQIYFGQGSVLWSYPKEALGKYPLNKDSNRLNFVFHLSNDQIWALVDCAANSECPLRIKPWDAVGDLSKDIDRMCRILATYFQFCEDIKRFRKDIQPERHNHSKVIRCMMSMWAYRHARSTLFIFPKGRVYSYAPIDANLPSNWKQSPSNAWSGTELGVTMLSWHSKSDFPLLNEVGALDNFTSKESALDKELEVTTMTATTIATTTTPQKEMTTTTIATTTTTTTIKKKKKRLNSNARSHNRCRRGTYGQEFYDQFKLLPRFTPTPTQTTTMETSIATSTTIITKSKKKPKKKENNTSFR